MRAVLAACLASSVAGSALAASHDRPPSPAPTVFERAIEGVRAGRVAAPLDREVYEAAREDLGDLRVFDDGGRLVPFLIDRGYAPVRPADVAAALRNQGWTADGAASAVADFGSRVRKARLRLELSGDNFRRRVALEGSDDGASWTTVLDEAWVFAVPGTSAARYETLAFPENDFVLLRVTVHPGEGERGRVHVLGAVVPGEAALPLRERVVPADAARAEDARSRETWLTVELGARHQPFHAVELDVADARFFREVRVDARRDGDPVSWQEIGRGEVHRLEHDGRQRECLRLETAGRERALRVRVRNGDDRPLDVRSVRLHVPVERVVFEAAAGRSYRLAYGSGEGAPSFDLARTVGDAAAWTASATEASLGASRRAAQAQAPAPPWTERHPALLWAGLLAVVGALGWLTLRALRESR